MTERSPLKEGTVLLHPDKTHQISLLRKMPHIGWRVRHLTGKLKGHEGVIPSEVLGLYYITVEEE